MSCIRIPNGIICVPKIQKLRVADGRHIWVENHYWSGLMVFQDRHCIREYQNWWEDPLISQAITWFTSRGDRA